MVAFKMKNRKGKKKVRRIILVVVFCLTINIYILFNLGSLFLDVKEKKIENDKLSDTLIELKEEGEVLKVEVNKLKNPEYVAKYAREKFLYSKDNEYVIKLK